MIALKSLFNALSLIMVTWFGSAVFCDSQMGYSMEIDSIESTDSGGFLLKWSEGEGPFAIKQTDELGAISWNADQMRTLESAIVSGGNDSSFSPIRDFDQTDTEVNTYLNERMDERFVDDLSALIRIPTFRDDSADSEERMATNLGLIQDYLNARVAAFNLGQTTLQIEPFEWREKIDGVTRWVFGFRLGSGAQKFSILNHLDTVPPGNDSWGPLDPHIETRAYRGSKQPFIVGRGSIDNKGPSVLALTVLEAAAKHFDDSTAIDEWTFELAFDTAEETDFGFPFYLEAEGVPELGIVFDAFWSIRAEKGIERPIFRLPLGTISSTEMAITSLKTSAGAVNQIPDNTVARIEGENVATLDDFAANVSALYQAYGFDDENYRRANLDVSRDGSAVILTTTVLGAQHGSAPAENRAEGANPLVSLANFLAGLVEDGMLYSNGYGRMTQFIAWGWGTQVFGEKHPTLLERSDDVFEEGNGTSYALTKLVVEGSSIALSMDIRYAQGHQSEAWDGVTDGELSGASVFPQTFTALVGEFNALHSDAQLTFETVNALAPDIRDPESENFQLICSAYQDVIREPCPIIAVGGATDAHGIGNLIAAGALFTTDFGPPINFHGLDEGAPLVDFRLSAQILLQILLRQVK